MPALLDSPSSVPPIAIDVTPALTVDPAMYRCDCGRVFVETVSTHVACPSCGHDQPW